MQFSTLCKAYEQVASTSKRLEKTAAIAALLHQTPPEELEIIMLLLQGRVYPTWDKTTLGMSQKTAIKAIQTATGLAEREVVRLFKKTGDLGTVAAQLTAKKTQATLIQQDLTVEDVISTLQKIATIEGTNSVDRKLKLVAHLLGHASEIEAQYIIRILLEDLRIGIAEGTVRDSIVWWQLQSREGMSYTPETNSWSGDTQKIALWTSAVQDAIDRSNDLPKVAKTAAREGIEGLQSITLESGTPTKVMLAQRSLSMEDAFDRVGRPAAVEYKYDGFRMQIHKAPDGTITLFTRRLENVTSQFPDIVSLFQQSVKQSCILDAEVVGFDPATSRHLPFQHISQRIRRKYDIERLSKELPVEVNVFDILMLDGDLVYERPYTERRALLEKVVPALKGKIRPSTMIVTEDIAQTEQFYKDALEKGYEGLMFKSLDAPYKPGSRVGHMVKLKPTLDTLDLVVVGAEWGEGKRSGWLTSFTLACLTSEGQLVEIGRVGTGFKELEQEESITFQQMTELLEPDITAEKGKEVTVTPRTVLEIKFEEIQQSPSYSSGFALRFPRVVRIRSDRRLEEISTLDDVLDLYDAQKGKQ